MNNGRRYRVAHLITRLELGGAQQNTLYCVEHHDRDRFDVELIAGAGGMLDEEARSITDADVHLLPYFVREIAPFADLLALLRLRNHLAQRGIDVLHTHSSKAGILGRLAGHLAGVPVVIHTVHGWSFNETQPAWRRRLYIALERLAASLSHRLITVSRRDRERGALLRIGRREQYEVLRSGIELSRFRRPDRRRDAVRGKLGYAPEQFVVGTLSCLKPQKAPLDFVDAAAAAHRADGRLRFLIAGDGELRSTVESRIAELGLQEVVRMLGWRRDPVDLLHAMDLFLLTSRFEGLPRAVLQAMAAGVPVVATDVDGTPEVVRDGETGLLVPPGDPAAAAQAVVRMATDASLRDRCTVGAGRQLGARFDIGRMVERLDELYLFLLTD